MKQDNFNWVEISKFKLIEDAAKKKLISIEENCNVYTTPECQESVKILSKKFRSMKENFRGENEQKMLLEFDTLACDWASLRSESLFIQGFYEGINFLKQAIEEGTKENYGIGVGRISRASN